MLTHNIAIVGAVDAGKSSLIGVLSTGTLDDGNGKSRETVLTLKHEKESGRTSNINVVKVLNPFEKGTVSQIRFLDLAGHEKYLRTTLRGLTSFFPDYAILVISASKGITRITRDHFNICRSLSIPVLIVITKIDIAPPETFKQTLESVRLLCRRLQIKFTFDCSRGEGREEVLEILSVNPLVVSPIFSVSNVKGDGLDLLKSFLFCLPQLQTAPRANFIRKFASLRGIRKLFFILTPYRVEGIGLVLYGENFLEPIAVGDKLVLGPLGKEYVDIRVKSIHNEFSEVVSRLEPGQHGCLAIRPMDSKSEISKDSLKRGRVLINTPVLVNKVVADVVILTSSTTINIGYTPYIHCANVSVCGRIIGGDNFPLRSGKRSSVTFQFLTPQFIYPGARLVFRDGYVKGIGVIKEILP